MGFLVSKPFLSNLFLLLAAHAVTDYALQPDFMAKYKSPRSKPPKGLGPWWWSMTAHGLINGLGVALVTQGWVLGVGETLVHAITDYAKCTKKITTEQDQAIHIVSKFLWALSACRI